MNKILFPVFIFILLLFFTGYLFKYSSVYFPTRISKSPYPVSNLPDTLFVIDDQYFTKPQLLTIHSLQGILAQNKPKIYQVNKYGYKTWLNDLVQNYGIIADSSYISDFYGLINKFKNKISGYILTDYNTPSIYIASSMAGFEKTIIVTPKEEVKIKELGLTLIHDVRKNNYKWLLKNYEQMFNKNLLFYAQLNAVPYLVDYSIFSKSIFFYEEINSAITNKIFSLSKINTVLLGWGDNEFNLITRTSQNSIIVIPADWALNLSTLSNIGVETRQRSHITKTKAIENVHTVCFLMSDGDNIQWVLNKFSTNDRWYGNKFRNKIPLGWTISPSLTELAPTILKQLYYTASQNPKGRDYFVAAPSGYGYIFPDEYNNLRLYSSQLNKLLSKSDLHIVNIIGNSIEEKYLSAYLKQDNIDALFYYYYKNYSAGKGQILWSNNKPIVTGRYNLWNGFENSKSLAEKINHLSKNIHSQDGYSLIPVHVWSKSVDSVMSCIKNLNKNIRVVPPDEFVALIKENVNH